MFLMPELTLVLVCFWDKVLGGPGWLWTPNPLDSPSHVLRLQVCIPSLSFQNCYDFFPMGSRQYFPQWLTSIHTPTHLQPFILPYGRNLTGFPKAPRKDGFRFPACSSWWSPFLLKGMVLGYTSIHKHSIPCSSQHLISFHASCVSALTEALLWHLGERRWVVSYGSSTTEHKILRRSFPTRLWHS